MTGWRGRKRGLAIPTLFAAAGALVAVGIVVVASALLPAAGPAAAGTSPPAWEIVVRSSTGDVLARVPLPDRRFELRYRNSLYESTAEERFVVEADGRMSLVEMAADEAAVLDEYYVTAGPPRTADAGEALPWEAPPAVPVQLRELEVAASRHGQRTLIVGDRAMALWQLNGGAVGAVVLRAETAR